MRIAAAAWFYFTSVFGAGFLLGTVRTLWLEPLVGPLIAVLFEAPFFLATMVFASRWVASAVHLNRAWAKLALIGVGALFLQQGTDVAVGFGLRGIAPTGSLAQFATAPGLIHAALPLVFAAMPMLLKAWPWDRAVTPRAP